ncbi:hypothetical protein F5880DRAFT_1617853 [Lentinula raphanica]|nr:hypothetical protein F5880DRAFT_1617853 [Lentinula raphanica]
MPKVTSTPTFPSTPVLCRTTPELIKARTRMIVDRLMSIRASRSMSMDPPCPRFDPKTQKVVRKDLFHGASDNVNGPLHPGFWKLGKIFFVIKKLDPSLMVPKCHYDKLVHLPSMRTGPRSRARI